MVINIPKGQDLSDTTGLHVHFQTERTEKGVLVDCQVGYVGEWTREKFAKLMAALLATGVAFGLGERWPLVLTLLTNFLQSMK